jgi:hypothetical protein
VNTPLARVKMLLLVASDKKSLCRQSRSIHSAPIQNQFRIYCQPTASKGAVNESLLWVNALAQQAAPKG